MVFSSLFFLYAFLPLCLLFYLFAGKTKTKNIILLIFSLFFYAWGEPVYVLLMVMTGILVYAAGLKLDQHKESTGKKKFYLTFIIIVTLGSLAIFKYSGFIVSNLNLIPGINIPVPKLTLPIGISFYTFQTLTYAIDLYRGKAKVQKSLANFLLYVSLFPQLIAGPIVRYTDISEQIDNRKITLNGFSKGISRFLIGLGKKVLIANHAGEIVAQTIGSRLNDLSTTEAWLGILAFALQIYFDFSGYSDMAIGLGHMFGFDFKENFNYPYISNSITDFWRRWHISLSSFFRDYLYIPLGGNRKWQIRNMLIVWLLTGLWHGASWNFVLWGLYFFVLLTFEKLFLLKVLAKIPRFFGHIYSIFTVLLGWVFFYFTTPSEIGIMFTKMFANGAGQHYNVMAEILLQNELLFLVLAILLTTPIIKAAGKALEQTKKARTYHPVYTFTVAAIHLLLLLFCTASLAGSSFNPFLYFRF